MTDTLNKNLKIEIKNLSQEFINPDSGEILEVLNDISISVYEGNIISIIGPSGCGKTTLLKIIAGLTPHSKGQVLLNGKQVKEPADGRIMVFQDLHLFNWMTVYQNIKFSFSARNENGERVEKEITDLVLLAGLSGFESYYPHEISGGMRQRLALARALGANPSVLLLDEPFSSLDMGTKTDLEKEFLDLIKKKNVTTLLVTHDVRQAVYLGDKVVLLSKRPGKVRKIMDVPFTEHRDVDIWQKTEFHQLEVSLSKMLKEKI